MTQPDIELSELELAIQNRQRKTHEFDVPDVLGQSGKTLGKVRMRVATIAEQDQAVREAHAYAEQVARTGNAAMDPDLLENAKTAHILHKVCRNAKSEAPAFASPKWMLENMSVYELGKLLNNYNEMVRTAYPVEFKFGTEELEAFAEMCSKFSDTNAPNAFLQDFGRSEVAEIAIRMAILYYEKVKK